MNKELDDTVQATYLFGEPIAPVMVQVGLLRNTAVQDAGQRLDGRSYQTYFKFRKME